VHAWALRRQGPDTLPLQLRARRLYILPTRAGLAMAALAAVTFIAGMNYGSGLAMLLCFWLTGFLLVAMLQTHGSLAGARILAAGVRPAFATEPVRLELRLQCSDTDTPVHLQAPGATGTDGTSVLALHFATRQRGLWHCPALELSSTAPFGLFRCWTWLQPALDTEVYPRPAGTRPIPAQAPGATDTRPGGTGLDDLAGLRAFREGDSPRQVAWKAYARGLPLLVREYQGHGASARELRFDALAGLDTEQRLSQLARWVIDATAGHAPFTLVLPAQPPLHGSGAAHRQRCLAALARF